MLNTLEGEMHISFGDYIIQGIKGELYPCKSDIFEEIYEKVEEKNNGFELRRHRGKFVVLVFDGLSKLLRGLDIDGLSFRKGETVEMGEIKYRVSGIVHKVIVDKQRDRYDYHYTQVVLERE